MDDEQYEDLLEAFELDLEPSPEREDFYWA